MTLDEAIEHAKQKGKGNSKCAKDHRQLAKWLIEFRKIKKSQTLEIDKCRKKSSQIYPRYIDANSIQLPILSSQTDEESVRLAICCTPTAYVRDNIHTHWVFSRKRNGFDIMQCGACKEEYVAITDIVRKANYCPNCGARLINFEE